MPQLIYLIELASARTGLIHDGLPGVALRGMNTDVPHSSVNETLFLQTDWERLRGMNV